jgi:hypothetical protein
MASFVVPCLMCVSDTAGTREVGGIMPNGLKNFLLALLYIAIAVVALWYAMHLLGRV